MPKAASKDTQRSYIRGMRLRDAKRHTWEIEIVEPGFVWIRTHPIVKGERVIPISLDVANRLNVAHDPRKKEA